MIRVGLGRDEPIAAQLVGRALDRLARDPEASRDVGHGPVTLAGGAQQLPPRLGLAGHRGDHVALRADQAGETSFPEFLRASWEAGVVAYDIDLEARTCTYRGASGEDYVERYDAVQVAASPCC